jgi:YidC/Oxa1 family membrane protein insertase
MPAPGSPAEKALEERRLKSGKEHKKFTIPGLTHEPEVEEIQDSPVEEAKPKSGQRQQPKRKKRVKPAGALDGKPGSSQQPGGRQPAGRPQSGAKPSAAADKDA